MIKDIDVEQLKLQYYDGKSVKPEYNIGKPADSDSDQNHPSESESTTATELIPYPANCHCGAVRYTVRVPSLTDGHHSVLICNCSICVRQGYLFVYPKHRNQLSFHTGYDHLRSYRFGNKQRTHKFCSTCGSSVFYESDETLGINVSPKIIFFVPNNCLD